MVQNELRDILLRRKAEYYFAQTGQRSSDLCECFPVARAETIETGGVEVDGHDGHV